MYIQRIKKKQNGKVYTSVVLARSYRESGKQKREIIANLSKMPTEFVDGLEAVIKGEGLRFEQLESRQGKSFGGVYVFSEIAKKVGLTQALGRSDKGKLALLQIIARVLSPSSQLSISNHWKKHYAGAEVLKTSDFDHHDLYNNLTWLCENQDKIEDRLFKWKYKFGDIKNIYLYDVTSSYLEGNKNELADYGYNRDKKSGKKQIVIGLLCDEEGEPISVEVFKGNTNDTKTFASQLKKLKGRFGLDKVVMVGDKGMIKSAQIDGINAEKCHYITTITKPQIKKMVNEGTFQMSLFENELMEVETDGIRYLLRKNPVRDQEMKTAREGRIRVVLELFGDQNIYLKEHPRAQVKVAARKVKEKAKKLKLGSFLICEQDDKTRTLKLVIDEEKKDEIASLDGCYVMKTNLSKSEVPAQIIHDRYKDLGKVENAFRTMKTTLLQLRPLHVRKEENTRGLVFLCMLAYKLVWHFKQAVESKIDGNVKDAIDCLIKVQYIEYSYKNLNIKRIPDVLMDDQQEILNLLGIKFPKKL